MQNRDMIYGYARVSTAAQDPDSQFAQLKAAGCEKVFREKITGTTADRPQLRKLMAVLAPGDVVITPAVDRLRGIRPTFWSLPATCSALGRACVRSRSLFWTRPATSRSLCLPCLA